MRFPPIQPKHALVTGCSSGIGAATAAVLRDDGWRVVATARKAKDIEALKLSGFPVVRLDLADEASIKAAADEVMDLLDGAPGALVNNAGFGQAGAIEDLSREVIRYQFEVNVFGMQQLTNLFLPVFRRRGCGRIVNVSSVVGRVALPFNGLYSASKFAMEALSDALRVELRETGIAVSLIEPGPVSTAFGTNAVARAEATLPGVEGSPFHALYRRELSRRVHGHQPARPFTATPEAVAKKILHALASSRPKTRYGVTLPAHAGAWMRRLAPYALTDALFRRALRKRLREVDGGVPPGQSSS